MNLKFITRLVTIAIVLLLYKTGFSNNLTYQTVEWDTALTANIDISKYQKDYSAVILKDRVIFEYAYEGTTPYLYQTVHKRILVLNDKGVESFNRVFIPISEVLEFMDLRVRTISKTGETFLFDASNLKQIDNLEEKGSYKLFAIDGIQIGSIIEMLYTLKKFPIIAGRYTFQEKYPVIDAQFELTYPQNLSFDAKAYNADALASDSVVGGNWFHIFQFKNMEASHEEQYSSWEANKVRVDYSMVLNNQTSTNAWNSYAQNIYKRYSVFTKRELKPIKKILKSLDIAKYDEEKKIESIENYIKSKFEFKNQQSIEQIESIEYTLQNGYTSEIGYIRLFAAFFEAAKIKYSLGFTTNRMELKFDPKFPTSRYLNEPIFYFASLDKYLMPTEYRFRLGDVPPALSFNYGLFASIISVGDMQSVLPDIRFIEGNTMEQNFTKQTFSISFDSSLNYSTIDYQYELGGREADYIRPYYNALNDNKKSDIITNILYFLGNNTKVESYSVSNIDNAISSVNQSFVLNSKLKVYSLLESAQDDYLFNIGNVIGPQVEMYAVQNRVNPVEINYKHYYNRSISVAIPTGYEVQGLEQLKIDKNYEFKNEKAMGFTSSYSIDGNILTVNVYEYYNSIMLPISDFENFRTIINAAADFNKISILFVKKL